MTLLADRPVRRPDPEPLRLRVRPREPHPALSAELVICADDVCSLAVLTSLAPDRFRLELDDVAVLAGMATSADWHFRAEQFAGRAHQVEVWADGALVCTLGAVTIPAEDARRHFALTGTTFARVSPHPTAERTLTGPVATPS